MSVFILCFMVANSSDLVGSAPRCPGTPHCAVPTDLANLSLDMKLIDRFLSRELLVSVAFAIAG